MAALDRFHCTGTRPLIGVHKMNGHWANTPHFCVGSCRSNLPHDHLYHQCFQKMGIRVLQN